MNVFLALFIIAFVSYLLGSFNPSILIAKIFFRKEIRELGSGNAGMTNVLRNLGVIPAVITTLFDFGKAVLAVYLAKLFIGSCDENINIIYGMYTGAFFVIIGHIFPIFFKFKGGKGVLTIAGAVMLMHPFMVLISIGIFILILILTKFVSLSSMLSISAFPFALIINATIENNFILDVWYEISMAFLMVGLIIFMHRKNIERLIHKTERKISVKKGSKKDNDNFTP